jgi:hypothetical protein
MARHRTMQSALSSAFMAKNVFKITLMAVGSVTGNFILSTMLKIKS